MTSFDLKCGGLAGLAPLFLLRVCTIFVQVTKHRILHRRAKHARRESGAKPPHFKGKQRREPADGGRSAGFWLMNIGGQAPRGPFERL